MQMGMILIALDEAGLHFQVAQMATMAIFVRTWHRDPLL
jgi:hypothetical protein